MKILFATLCALEMNTSAMIRNNGLIKGLVQNNVQIDILTIAPDPNSAHYDTNISWDETINIIKLKKNSVYEALIDDKQNLLSSIMKKLLPILRFFYHALNLFDNTIFIAKAADKDVLPYDYYDIIISSSDPKSSHYAVAVLIKQGLKYGKWIEYWGDPLTIDITQKALLPRWYVKRKEKQLFSCADSIVYVSPITYEQQRKLFPDFAEKMSFIPVPYSKEKIYPRMTSTKVTVGYFGDYAPKIRNVAILYEVCRKWHKGDIELLIVGDSILKLNTTDNISILPRVSQQYMEELEATCDILVCVLNKSGTQIPGKVYHYAATNKPILVVLDGENKDWMRTYLKKFERFVICENSEQEIAEAILSIIQSNIEYRPSPHFAPEYIAKQLLSM